MSSPVPVTVAAVGPLTNIALLLRVFPEAAERIGRLVVMGGSATRGGNVTAAAEFNVWADAEGAQAVLTATLPTVLVGLDVTLPTVLDEDGIARFAAAGPVGAQAAAMLRLYLDHARTAYGTSGVASQRVTCSSRSWPALAAAPPRFVCTESVALSGPSRYTPGAYIPSMAT